MSAETDLRVSRARERLGVGPKAGTEEVRRAFRTLSKELHPDHGGDPDGFEELYAAYELLRATARERTEEGWIVDDPEDAEPVRVAYESAPRRARRSFHQLFVEALRSAGRTDGPNGADT